MQSYYPSINALSMCDKSTMSPSNLSNIPASDPSCHGTPILMNEPYSYVPPGYSSCEYYSPDTPGSTQSFRCWPPTVCYEKNPSDHHQIIHRPQDPPKLTKDTAGGVDKGRVKKRPSTRNKESKRKCTNCGARKTPSWRRGLTGSNLLCNACGLYERVNGKKRRVMIQPDGSVKVARGEGTEHGTCAQCHTSDAKRWRKVEGHLYCVQCTTHLASLEEPFPEIMPVTTIHHELINFCL